MTVRGWWDVAGLAAGWWDAVGQDEGAWDRDVLEDGVEPPAPTGHTLGGASAWPSARSTHEYAQALRRARRR